MYAPISWIAALALTVLVAPVPSEPVQSVDPLVTEALSYSTEAAFGERYRFSWNYSVWGGAAVDPVPQVPDTVMAGLIAATDATPTLTTDVANYFGAVMSVVAVTPQDVHREWTRDESRRVVAQWDDVELTEYVNRIGSAFSYTDGEFGADGGPSMNGLYLTADEKAVGTKSLAKSVFEMLPAELPSTGSWLSTMTWNSSSQTVNGRERVRLESPVGIPGVPGSEYVILFERNFGVMVPVLIYQRDDIGTNCVAFKYASTTSPEGGTVPFPSGSVTVDRMDDGVVLEQSTFTVGQAPSSQAELRLRVPSDVMLVGQLKALNATEKSVLDRRDPATWPQRVLDALVFE